MKIPASLSIHGNEKIAEDIISRMWGRRGKFTCTVASTKTSAIPGVSEAGDTPELTQFTGPADGELLMLGKTVCMKGIPINPGGIPTPATLTLSALKLAGMKPEVIDAGCIVKPAFEGVHSGEPMADTIISGKAIRNPRKLYDLGMKLGKEYAKDNDYLVVSESCAGGTTTSLAVMMAMGTVKENLVSSSSPNNPRELKTKLVNQAMEVCGIKPGELKDDPLKAVEYFGDPMIPLNAGIIVSASKKIPVVAGGGTQMGSVMAVALGMDRSCEGNLFQGTTRWLMGDRNANMKKIMTGISDKVPIVYANMDYSKSPYPGLQAYEKGFIKEGVGCGAACVTAVVSSEGKVTCDSILDELHSLYRQIMGIN